jgi:hypothetical protein
MPDRKEFDLGDYIEVKDRIARFYELYAGGRLVTEEVRASTEPDGKPRIWVKAAAYRTADDPRPGIGWSWLELPGTTPYTKGSELENAETSAWGRAIGSLGILIDKSIASAQEIKNKAEPKSAAPVRQSEPSKSHDTVSRPPVAPQRPAAPTPLPRPDAPSAADADIDSLLRTAPGGPPRRPIPMMCGALSDARLGPVETCVLPRTHRGQHEATSGHAWPGVTA